MVTLRNLRWKICGAIIGALIGGFQIHVPANDKKRSPIRARRQEIKRVIKGRSSPFTPSHEKFHSNLQRAPFDSHVITELGRREKREKWRSGRKNFGYVNRAFHPNLVPAFKSAGLTLQANPTEFDQIQV
jgi:hypothetical protein